MNLPNQLTLLRFLSVPLLVCSYFLLNNPWITVSLFIGAALTDWLDGYAARVKKQETELGRFLDPVADKLLVVTVLILAINQYHTHWVSLPAIIIICREVTVSALREWLARHSSDKIESSDLGKAKTAFQMIALGILVAQPNDIDNAALLSLGVVLLNFSGFLAIVSMAGYVKSVWPHLTFSVKQE